MEEGGGGEVIDCICPKCGENLAIDGKEHIPGCPYILSPAEERYLDEFLATVTESSLPELQPKP
jgi:hypothetical protein